MPGLISKNSPPKLGREPSPKGEGGGSLLEPPPPSLTSFEASPYFLRLRAIALALRAGSRFAVREATPPNLGGELPALPARARWNQYVAGSSVRYEFVSVGLKQEPRRDSFRCCRSHSGHVTLVIFVPFFERKTGIGRRLTLRASSGKRNHAAGIVAEFAMVETL